MNGIVVIIQMKYENEIKIVFKKKKLFNDANIELLNNRSEIINRIILSYECILIISRKTKAIHQHRFVEWSFYRHFISIFSKNQYL